MGNSLGDYIIERYSSSDIKNIKWTKKYPKDTKKTKKKKPNKKYPHSSGSNIIYPQKIKKVSKPLEKVFKVEEIKESKKSKEKKPNKKYQNSSASKCKIKQEFKRPGR
ncbi:MAG: hypothetical protein QQN62_06255 [Nitrosopumilus sp.]